MMDNKEDLIERRDIRFRHTILTFRRKEKIITSFGAVR